MSGRGDGRGHVRGHGLGRTSGRPAGRTGDHDLLATVPVTNVTSPPVSSDAACGWGQGTPPAQWDHVVIVIFENKSLSQIFDPTQGAPFFQSVASSCGLATEYWSVWPKSLANYLALTSGDTHGQTVDPPPSATPIAGDSIFQRLGPDWRVLAETATQNCQMNNDGTLYEARHVPSLYYTTIRGACPNQTRSARRGPRPLQALHDDHPRQTPRHAHDHGDARHPIEDQGRR